MAGIRLEFAQFGHFDSFDIIRSITSIADVADEDLPAPIATSVKTMYYVDSTVVKGVTYFYKVRVWRENQSFISDEVECFSGVYWNPLNLINIPKSWIDTDAVDVDSSNRVSKMIDLSDNNYHFTQSNNSYKPLFSTSKISFDGVDDYLLINSAQADIYRNQSKAYLFFVIESLTANTTIRPVFITIGGVSTRIGLHQLNATQMRFSLRTDESDALQSVLFNYAANEKMIVYCEVDLVLKTAKLFKNGVLVGSASMTTALSVFSNTTPSLYPQIGNGGGGVSAWHGNLFAFVTDANLLPTSDRQKLEGWAAWKYGLTVNLPANHPYKDEPPLTDD